MQFDEGEQSAYTGSVLLKYSSIFFHLCLVHLSPWYVGWLGIQNCLLAYLRSQSELTMPLSRQCGNLSGNELTRNLSGNIQPQSSRLAEPTWTDPSIKSGSCVYQLISTSKTKKEKKKVQAENGWSNIFPKSSQVRKKPPPVPPVCVLTCTRNCCVWTLTKCMVGYSLLSAIPWSGTSPDWCRGWRVCTRNKPWNRIEMFCLLRVKKTRDRKLALKKCRVPL